jgi:hypothetical protein
MQGIYTYIPETNHVRKEYNVATILSLLFMVTISLAPALTLMYFYISTFRSMRAVPNMAVFCSSLTSWFPGIIIIIISSSSSSSSSIGSGRWRLSVSYSYYFLTETTLWCTSVFIVVSHQKTSLCCTAAFRRISHFIFKHRFHYLSLWVCNSINGLDYHSDSTSHSTKPLRCTCTVGAVNKLHALCVPWCWTWLFGFP